MEEVAVLVTAAVAGLTPATIDEWRRRPSRQFSLTCTETYRIWPFRLATSADSVARPPGSPARKPIPPDQNPGADLSINTLARGTPGYKRKSTEEYPRVRTVGRSRCCYSGRIRDAFSSEQDPS
jgi:hypothetical protein